MHSSINLLPLTALLISPVRAMAEIPEELPAVFAATTEEDLERLAVETAQLEQMVQVERTAGWVPRGPKC